MGLYFLSEEFEELGYAEFLKDNVVKISEDNIKYLKDCAKNNDINRYRYCFHDNEQAEMQEMLFYQGYNSSVKPHFHPQYAETQVIIKGEAVVVLFDNDKNILDKFKVSTDSVMLWRIEKNIVHMMIPISDEIVVFEARQGKFQENTNIYPEWGDDMDYIKKLVTSIRKDNKLA